MNTFDDGLRDHGRRSKSADVLSGSSSQPSLKDFDVRKPTEYSPLLPSHEHNDHDVSEAPKIKRQSSIVLVSIIALTILMASFGESIIVFPQTRIIESILCYDYYERNDPSKLNFGRDVFSPGAIGGVDETHCKVNEVQDQLYALVAYQQFFDAIPGLLLIVPYGWAADRYGRWRFTFIGLVSWMLRAAFIQFVLWNWQVLDLRLIWISSVHGLFGGGEASWTALMFATLSDVVSEADRAAVFLRLGAVDMSASVIMPVVAAWLMRIDPWIPCLMGIALRALAVLVWLMMPETLNYYSTAADELDRESCSCVGAVATSQQPNRQQTSLLRRVAGSVHRSMSFLFDDWRLIALIIPFLGHFIPNASRNLLLQYISKRYYVVIAQATLIITVQNSVTVFILLAGFPWLSTILVQAYHLSGPHKDLILARVSFVCQMLGWLAVGLAPSLPLLIGGLAIASLGSADLLLLRSLIASMVPPQHLARTYSVMSIADNFGSMGGASVLKTVFKKGLEWGGFWIGLPFMVIALCSAVFVVLAFSVPVRSRRVE